VRRVAAALALWLCAAVPAFAQNADNLPVVGILRGNTADNVEPFATGFRDALAALGLVDGRNIRLEVRLAEGHLERLPELAQSLVQAKARVILAFGPPAIRAAQQATSTIPIVGNADLLASGLIASLARPGGNTTGVSMLNTELRHEAAGDPEGDRALRTTLRPDERSGDQGTGAAAGDRRCGARARRRAADH
jgi:putative ABC transport system substrate-binding protein